MNASFNKSFWKGRSVFITGHTGFKGSWLSLLLHTLGAEVHGYSLPAPTKPSLFEALNIGSLIASSTIGDIRDLQSMTEACKASRATVGLHLAAQPMVLSSYDNPLETYDVNVSGTASFLQAALSSDTLKSVVVITTDKCYENKEWERPYKEDDTLGGHDPYSNSKACCELVAQSFQKSFFLKPQGKRGIIGLATARAGNIIGGGDWGIYRLVPDFFRSYLQNEPLLIRNPHAIRPWQHVLEPITGYLTLAEKCMNAPLEFSSGWNFGPNESLVKSVSEVISELQAHFPHTVPVHLDSSTNKMHEAQLLRLDCTKAKETLGWQPRWDFAESIKQTVKGYDAMLNGSDLMSVLKGQIEEYFLAK